MILLSVSSLNLLMLLCALGAASFIAGVQTVRWKGARSTTLLADPPNEYGWFTFFAGAAPGLAAALTLYFATADAFISLGCGLAMACAGVLAALLYISPSRPVRRHVERVQRWTMLSAAALVVLIAVALIGSLLSETVRFFLLGTVSLPGFLTGTEWTGQTAAHFGALPLIAGTAMVALIAMCVALPVGLMAAIFMAEYASPGLRRLLKPMIEILAGIPTVVYGFFALLTVAPAVRWVGESLNSALMTLTPGRTTDIIETAPVSALASGLVVGIMILPIIASLSDDAIRAVPAAFRQSALALGATPAETLKGTVLPAALPGIAAACLLAVSRAIGETMIVLMAAGRSPNLTANPFEGMSTVTVQIVALLTGDPDFEGPRVLSAFALGFTLFAATLIFNLFARAISGRIGRQYV